MCHVSRVTWQRQCNTKWDLLYLTFVMENLHLWNSGFQVRDKYIFFNLFGDYLLSLGCTTLAFHSNIQSWFFYHAKYIWIFICPKCNYWRKKRIKEDFFIVSLGLSTFRKQININLNITVNFLNNSRDFNNAINNGTLYSGNTWSVPGCP